MMDSRMKQSLDRWITTEPEYEEEPEELELSEFKPLRRTQSFFCIGNGGHESKGTPHTINNVGPFCGHCMTYIFQLTLAKEKKPCTQTMQTLIYS